MITLTKNEFTNGKCWYADEFNNTFFFRRNEKGFVAKIRFNDKNVVAEPFTVKVPAGDEPGQNLIIKYLDGVEKTSDDIKGGIQNFTELVQRWINMLLDVAFLECPLEFAKGYFNRDDLTNEMLSEHKVTNLEKYEELAEIINKAF